MPSLLALDASKYVGWAFFRSADDKPKCRTWVAQGLWDSEEYASYFLAFENWLLEMLTVLQPDMLAFEGPIVVARGGWGENRGNDENNIRRLIGIVSIAELVAKRRNMPSFEVGNTTAKSFMGVSARRQQGESDRQFKDRMIIAITARGFSVADSHQADAAAIGLVVYDSLEEA